MAAQEPEEARREETAKVMTPAGNLAVRGGTKQRVGVMAANWRPLVLQNNRTAENAAGLPLVAANAEIAHDTGRSLFAAWTTNDPLAARSSSSCSSPRSRASLSKRRLARQRPAEQLDWLEPARNNCARRFKRQADNRGCRVRAECGSCPLCFDSSALPRDALQVDPAMIGRSEKTSGS